MRLLVQRSKASSVMVDNKIVGSITNGLVVLVGFKTNDTINDIKYLVKKLIGLRIFDDENHIMNKSVIDIEGSILSISQFTLYADTKKGNRPSYINSMKADDANKMYNLFNEELKNNNIKVETGIFQADMIVNIINDGPVTILLESGD
ncbi:MAG: D-aminoacyl-tRNA deacylase [Bacilli bacterium]